MAKTGETAAHLGPAVRRSGAARLHGSAAPLGAWFAVATHRRLGSRCGTALPRRPVDGERSRAGRYRGPHGPRTSGRRGDVAGRVAGGESARLAVDTTHMVQCVSDMGVDY